MKRIQKFFYHLIVTSGLYGWWSRVYQLLWDRPYRGRSPAYRGLLSPESASRFVRLIPYRHDTWREMGDAFHHPCAGDHLLGEILRINELDPDQPFETARATGEIPLGLTNACRARYNHKLSWDCDDSALWCAHAVRDEYHARVLNVVWRTGRWPRRTGGHNLCLVLSQDGYYHLGNWPMAGPFDSVASAVLDVLAKVGKTEKDLVGFHVLDPERLVGFVG